MDKMEAYCLTHSQSPKGTHVGLHMIGLQP